MVDSASGASTGLLNRRCQRSLGVATEYDGGTPPSLTAHTQTTDSTGIVLHTVGFRRLLLATLAYHPVFATRQQQGRVPYGRALETARAVAAAQHAEIAVFFAMNALRAHSRRQSPAGSRLKRGPLLGIDNTLAQHFRNAASTRRAGNCGNSWNHMLWRR